MEPTARVLIGTAISVHCVVYLMPTFVALLRDAAAKTEIVVLNVAFGWTGIGWLAALLLAFGTRNNRRARSSAPAGPR